jgi:flagellar motor switch protein FliM
MSLADLQAPANVPEHVVSGVRGELEYLAPKCGLAVTSVIGREASLRIALVEASAAEPSGEYACYRVGAAGHRCAALLIAAPAVARLAELFMGGTGGGTDRQPSALEGSIVERRLGSLLMGLDAVLAQFGVDGHEVAALETFRDLSLEPHQVRVTIEIVIDDVAIPMILILPASHHAVRANVPLDTTSVFAEALRDIPLSVSVRFESVVLTAEELDDLEPGDVIRLEQPENASLVGIVDNQRVFVGRAGRRGRRLAVEIFEVCQ